MWVDVEGDDVFDGVDGRVGGEEIGHGGVVDGADGYGGAAVYLIGSWRRESERGHGGRERVEGDLGGGVLGLAESGAVLRAVEDLAVKVDGGLDPGRVVRTFPNARVGREVEAAPLGQF
nr:hypothetical protein CFP56_43195 [Quercus suber]